MSDTMVVGGSSDEAAAANERDHAIVVGISHYSPLMPLQGPVNDAHCFAEWLSDTYGGEVPKQNIQLIVSSASAPGAAPTLQQVENALYLHIRNYRVTQKRQRRLYLFFAGHGVTSGHPSDTDKCRVLMADATRDFLQRNIGVGGVCTVFERMQIFEEVVLVSDCCREHASSFARVDLGISAAAAPIIEKAAPNLTVEVVEAFATGWKQVARERLLPACADDGQTYCRGRFTYALLDGLRRAIDEHGAVTRLSLARYVERIVEMMTGDGSQSPQIKGSDTMVLARPPPPKDVRILVRLADPTKGFRIRHGDDLTEVPVTVVRHPDPDLFELALSGGLYAIASPGLADDEDWQPLAAIGALVGVEL